MNALKAQNNENHFKDIISSNKRQKRQKSKRSSINNEKNNLSIETNNKNDKKPLFFYSDKKIFLLLKRTFYMNELEKTERYINSEKFLGQNYNLTKDEFNSLVTKFNNLLRLQKLYINFEDLFKSLQLQNKIIHILKIYIMNKEENK